MIRKNCCIVYLHTQTSQIDCFRSVHKIPRGIEYSDLKSFRARIAGLWSGSNTFQSEEFMDYLTFDTMSFNHHVFRITITNTNSLPGDTLWVIFCTFVTTADWKSLCNEEFYASLLWRLDLNGFYLSHNIKLTTPTFFPRLTIYCQMYFLPIVWTGDFIIVITARY